MLVENFLECYHCAVAHPGLADVIDVDQDAYRLERHPTFASHFAHVRERPRDARYDAAGIDGQFHLVWPALKVNVMPGRPNLSIGPLTPVAPREHRGVLDYFFAPDEDPAWIADFMALDDEVGAEDRVLVESVQRGMAAGVLEHGELLLPSEDLIAAFQRWVADGASELVARERERPRARADPLARPRRRRGDGGRRTPPRVAVISESVWMRVRHAPRPSAELHCTRTLAESGSPSTMR